ncbi:hypothetical protein SCREM2_gp103 [Synechococcus phage S-CREM2]|nr:hypothetical protein SCREM2_gp103 [Synechococcus phage S-CREM2]
MSYSARTEEEAQQLMNHYQSNFPHWAFRLREHNG